MLTFGSVIFLKWSAIKGNYKWGTTEVGRKAVWYHKSPVEEGSLKGGMCWTYPYQVHKRENKRRTGVDHWIWQDKSHLVTLTRFAL